MTRHILQNIYEQFTQEVQNDLGSKKAHNKLSIEKLAASFGISDKTEVKELTELAIVKRARALAHSEGSTGDRFDKIVELYYSQVNLSHRTSQSILLQQYSTPAPIAYLAGVFCGIDRPSVNSMYFEPSAGNGLLTIAGDTSRFVVNEIDRIRNRNLQVQGFVKVLQQDATRPFNEYQRSFDAVLTNPPFGVMEAKEYYDSFGIKPLEHVMALRALDTMKDFGKAAIIIGGHTTWDEKGRIQAGKNRIFFNYLYSRYYVVDVINIDGHKLYSRQGTSFNVRLILIDGRKSIPQGAAVVYNASRDIVVKTFDDLLDRVLSAQQIQIPMQPMHDLENEALALQLHLELNAMSTAMSGMDGTPVDFTKLYVEYLSLKKRQPKKLLLFEIPDVFMSFDQDAALLSKILKTGLIHSKSSSYDYHMTSISRQLAEIRLALLMSAGHQFIIIPKKINSIANIVRQQAMEIYKGLDRDKIDLGAPYEPASDACIVLNSQVPDSMAFETKMAVHRIKEEVGGDMDNFVRHRLKYPTKAALCKVLSAEQIDAVAIAIYNIEARGQGMIIGDQTGIGKGRIAAAMIRYAVLQGLKPVFLTEKANLFSDIYRDLSAIGSAHLKPFIVNGRESKTDIKDEDGEVIYQAPAPTEQQSIIESRMVPTQYDFVLGTYSQFNSPEKSPRNRIYSGRLLQAIFSLWMKRTIPADLPTPENLCRESYGILKEWYFFRPPLPNVRITCRSMP